MVFIYYSLTNQFVLLRYECVWGHLKDHEEPSSGHTSKEKWLSFPQKLLASLTQV